MSRNPSFLFSNKREHCFLALLHKVVIRITGIMSLKAFGRWKRMTEMENDTVMKIRMMHILSTLVEKNLHLFWSANQKHFDLEPRYHLLLIFPLA